MLARSCRVKRKATKKEKKAAAGPSRRYITDSPLSRLISNGVLNIYEHTAADEIIAAYRMGAGLPVSRDPLLDIPRPIMQFDAADERAAKRSDLSKAFPTWKLSLQGTPELMVAMAVLITEQDPRDIDARLHQRRGTARTHLISALRHFAAIRGNVPRGARDWKYVSPAKKEKAA